MRVRRASSAILLVVLATFVGWLGYIGYFGGGAYIEVPALRKRAADTAVTSPRTVAVLFSGDLGFRVGMAPRIAARLAADGIPVLGVSSLAEFRQRRTPAEVRVFIARSIERALAFARADRVILIGQSFGADMLQVGAPGLPAHLRAKVPLVALVVPGDSVIFRASPAELFNWAKPDAAALPTARQLNWVPAICIYGREEENSLCPQLNLPNVERVALPGGHPLHRDADALYAVLRRKIAAAGGAGNITKSSGSGQVRATVAGVMAGADRTGEGP